MEIILEINSIPPSVNHYWLQGKNNKRYISAKGKAWKEEVYYVIKTRFPGLVPKKNYFDLDILIHVPDKRRRDIDNFFKPILDSLESLVYFDDSQVLCLSIKKVFSNKAKTVIKIKYLKNFI